MTLGVAQLGRGGVASRVMEQLSVTQAAEALGITRRAVLYRIEAGTLPAVLVGAQWAIPAEHVRGLADLTPTATPQRKRKRVS